MFLFPSMSFIQYPPPTPLSLPHHLPNACFLFFTCRSSQGYDMEWGISSKRTWWWIFSHFSSHSKKARFGSVQLVFRRASWSNDGDWLERARLLAWCVRDGFFRFSLTRWPMWCSDDFTITVIMFGGSTFNGVVCVGWGPSWLFGRISGRTTAVTCGTELWWWTGWNFLFLESQRSKYSLY